MRHTTAIVLALLSVPVTAQTEPGERDAQLVWQAAGSGDGGAALAAARRWSAAWNEAAARSAPAGDSVIATGQQLLDALLSLALGCGNLPPYPELLPDALAVAAWLRESGVRDIQVNDLLDAVGDDAVAFRAQLLQAAQRVAAAVCCDEVDADRRAARIREAALARDQISIELRAAVAARAGGTLARGRRIDATLLASRLDADTAFVLVVRHECVRFDGRPPQRAATTTYTALPLQQTGAVRAVALGPAAAMDQHVDNYREGVQRGRVRGDRTGDAEAASLRAALVAPILAALPGAKTIVLSAPPPLCTVPWDVLACDKGRPTKEQVTIAAVTASLVPPVENTPGVGLLVAGGIDPNAPPTPESDGGVRTGPFQSLAHAAREAEQVQEAYQRKFGATPSTLLVGRHATKDALTTGLQAARFGHLAGNFWSLPASPEARFAGNGLALAGANGGMDASGLLPGVLSAEELLALDLRRCELLVLSGCETAIGPFRNQQSVASFGTAAHLAGARFVLTCLWRVSDEGAAAMMREFYRCWWEQGLSPHAALRKAQQTMAQGRHNERDWAGWAITGW